MNKLYAWISLCLILMLLTPSLCLGASDEKQVKYGTLSQNERWEGDIYLIGDVTIPKNLALTIAGGSTIHFANFDILKSGKKKDQSEFITYGKLQFESSEDRPIVINHLAPSDSTLSVENKQVIKFEPYTVETSELKKEFRRFKNQYIVFWSIIYIVSYAQVFW